MKELKDKVALVTGAASGIGYSVARLFAEEGAKLVLSDINEDNLSKVADEFKSEGVEVAWIAGDVSKPEANEEMVQLALDTFGKLDIAVNNAGIGGAIEPVGNYPIEAWGQVIGINLSGVFYGMRYQIPAMEKTSKNSAIVNLASILGQVGSPGSSAYVAAKHGVVGLTKTAALEYSAKGIRVNAVGPAYIDTPLLEALDKEVYDSLVNIHPIGRLGKPEEVANLILFLVSDKSYFVNGGYYPIDGGYLSQ